MATRRTICLTSTDVDIFNIITTRPDAYEEIGKMIASALMGGVTVMEAATLALYDIEIDTVSSERGVMSKEAQNADLARELNERS